jgi:frataxin-like iron-binding protein CyaY
MTPQKNQHMKINLLQLKEKLKTLSGDDFDFEVADYLLTIKFDEKTLNQMQKRVVSTNILDNEVFNGGFDQFYLNNEDEYIDDAIDGLREFGATEFLELTIKSKEIYLRDKELYAHDRNPHFDTLDDRFYELNHYGELRINYVKAHLDEIIK